MTPLYDISIVYSLLCYGYQFKGGIFLIVNQDVSKMFQSVNFWSRYVYNSSIIHRLQEGLSSSQVSSRIRRVSESYSIFRRY